MSGHVHASERTRLLSATPQNRRLSILQQQDEAESIVDSSLSKEERALATSTVGERLPYNDYTTIDYLHDGVSPSSILYFVSAHLMDVLIGQRFLSIPPNTLGQECAS